MTIVIVFTALNSNMELVNNLLLLALPLGWIGYGLLAFLLWLRIYGTLATNYGPPADAVIVLGAGLLDGKTVGPLLRARIDKGIEWAHKSTRTGHEVTLVMSGGKGDDEHLPEGVAMFQYAQTRVRGPLKLLKETQSTSTKENLVLSMRLLNAHSETRTVAVVTSHFHVLRAALLMRALGIPGYSVGASTGNYYVPSAILREYAAVLRDNMWLNIAGIAACQLPIILTVVIHAL